MNAADLLSGLYRGDTVVCVVGLGCVGMPLAIEFSKKLKTIGFDVEENKVSNTTGSSLTSTSNPALIKEADFIIICVPTPVTRSKDPDLSYIESASKTIGKNLKKGSIVVLESTVYPGVTEEVMLPILEQESKMACGSDFAVGYSPERINPGDDEHALSKITKIVFGMDKDN